MDKNKILGENKALGVPLTDDEIKEIAKKQYKNTTGAGPKTEAGKKKALQNLKRQAPRDVPIEKLPDKANISFKYMTSLKVLNDDELHYFTEQWNRYYEEFEMNKTSDEALLFKAIMAELVLNRLYREQLNDDESLMDPKISEQIQRLSKVHDDALKSLGATRQARLGAKGNIKDNIATLIQEFDEQIVEELKNKDNKDLGEEDELLDVKMPQYMRELTEFESATFADDVEEDPEVLAEWIKQGQKGVAQPEPAGIWDSIVPVKKAEET